MYIIAVLLVLCIPLWSFAQPEPPTNLTIHADAANHLMLRWAFTQADSFEVLSSNWNPGGPYDHVAYVSAAQYEANVSEQEEYFGIRAWHDGAESLPCSNHVGYVRRLLTQGTQATPSFTALGLPFKFWEVSWGVPQYGSETFHVSDMFGSQLNCASVAAADRIWRQDTGAQAFRTGADCSWLGSLEIGEGALPGNALWYVNKSGIERNLIIAGEVDTLGNYSSILLPANVFMPYSWRDCRPLSVFELNLQESGWGGSIGDQIWQQNGGIFWFDQFGWHGSLLTIQPGKAFWIRSDSTIVYTYHANGNP